MSATAKELLIRWAYDQDLSTYRPNVREFVFAIDTSRLFIGTKEGPREIAFLDAVKNITEQKIKKYKPVSGTTTDITSILTKGQIGFDESKQRLVFRNPKDNSIQSYTTLFDLPLKNPVTIKVATENIDANDGNSVVIAGYRRPSTLIFVNGILAIDHQDAQYRYKRFDDTNTVKIYGLSAGDIITYY